jgi:hypothetical protein
MVKTTLPIKQMGIRTRKDGDRKFSMNQNFTVCSVLWRTLRIMIDTNLWKKNMSSGPRE